MPDGAGHLNGVNALGRLLMKVRDEFAVGGRKMECVIPPAITGFLLFGCKVSKVYAPEYYLEEYTV